MLPSSALLLLLGNFKSLTYINMKAGHIEGCDRLSMICAFYILWRLRLSILYGVALTKISHCPI